MSFFAEVCPGGGLLPPRRSPQALTVFRPGQTQNVAYPGGFVFEMTQGGATVRIGCEGPETKLARK